MVTQNENLDRWSQFLFDQAPGVHELRALGTGRGTVSGYFDNPTVFARAASQVDGLATGVYVTLNACKPELLARATNVAKPFAKLTTADADITCRRWLPIDFDPVRPAGISSTAAERLAALGRAKECRAWLAAQGWPEPILTDSGNGAHLLYAVDLPNDKAATETVRNCLVALALQWSDNLVSVDRTNFNAARIWKVYGTLARKGDSTPERPHRRAELIEVPTTLQFVAADLLAALAARVPAQPKASPPASTGQPFDLDTWIAQSGVTVVRTGDWNGGRKWILNPCPWNSDHTDNSAYILQLAGGAISAGCHHNGCAGKTWADLRPKPKWTKANDEDAVVIEGSRLSLTRLSDLLAEPPETVAYVWGNTLPKGGLSILAAKPKIGKSTLARALALAVARGEPFLGRATNAGPVVYLALEEKRSEVAGHFERMGAIDEAIYIHVGTAPQEALEAAIHKTGAVLAVVDTLFRLVRITDGNDYSQVTRALEPVLSLARTTGCHILLVHHAGKGEREGGDAILGSTALYGSVDTALMMRRRQDARTIESTQRYGVDLPKTVVCMDAATGRITDGGTVEALEVERAQGAVLETLGDGAMTEPEIKEAVGGDTRWTQTAIRELVKSGRLTRMGAGKKGDAYRYSLNAHLLILPYNRNEQNENEVTGVPRDDSVLV